VRREWEAPVARRDAAALRKREAPAAWREQEAAVVRPEVAVRREPEAPRPTRARQALPGARGQ